MSNKSDILLLEISTLHSLFFQVFTTPFCFNYITHTAKVQVGLHHSFKTPADIVVLFPFLMHQDCSGAAFDLSQTLEVDAVNEVTLNESFMNE